MTGILAVNAYLQSEKFNILHKHIENAAETMGITLKIKNNEELYFLQEKPDFVLFWDKDTCLAKQLENKGIPVFNSSRSIELCDDKAKTYLELENKVLQPETIVAPLSFFENDFTEFIQKAAQKLGFPLVFKERCGSFGEQVHLCNSVDEVLRCVGTKPFILQEFIAEANGSDVRIQVVDGQCVCAMKRINKNDFRSNITNGGTAEKYEPTDAEKALAIKACSALNLTFGGVDILCGKYVCEVNSNAHIINLLNVTGVDAAPLIFEAILKKI